MSVLSRPYFHNEEAAFEHLESVIWAEGNEAKADMPETEFRNRLLTHAASQSI